MASGDASISDTHNKYYIIFEDKISKDNVFRSTVEVLTLSLSFV